MRERKSPRKERFYRRAGEFPGAGGFSRANRYQLPAGVKIDYKNANLLQKYVTDRGKIVSRRISNLSAKRQRELSIAIKRARFLGLLPVGIRKK